MLHECVWCFLADVGAHVSRKQRFLVHHWLSQAYGKKILHPHTHKRTCVCSAPPSLGTQVSRLPSCQSVQAGIGGSSAHPDLDPGRGPVSNQDIIL